MSQAPAVLCAGIVVADHLCTPLPRLPAAGELVLAEDFRLALGGCAANVAVDLAKQNVPTAVIGKVGDDSFGGLVRDLLRQEGVGIDWLQPCRNLSTSQTMIVNVRGEDRRFIHAFGANAAFTAGDIPAALFPSTKVLYVGGYLLMPALAQEGLAEVFRSARAAGVVTVLDVAGPAGENYLGRLEKLLPECDLFLPNSDEAALILGEADPRRQALEFRRRGARTVVITCGNRGAVLASPTVRLEAGVFPTEVVDGSGSGDAFDAGYIAGLLRGEDEAGCLRRASALGASCVRALGTTAGVFTAKECEAFLAAHSLAITPW